MKWSRCAVKGSLFQRVEVPPRQRSSRLGIYPCGRGGNEAVEAWEKGGSVGQSASWQAATCVEASTVPERTRWVQFLGRGIREHGFGIGSSNEPIIRKRGEL